MNISERFYLDYNSTAPLSKKVQKAISTGEYPWANPSSEHYEGKKSRAKINEVKKFLYNLFGLDKSSYTLLFHSGATEGVNTCLNLTQNDCLFYSYADHACVTEHAKMLAQKGVSLKKISLSKDGKIANLKEQLVLNNELTKYVNITWMNNETGVVQDLTQLKNLKEQYPFYLHIDAVQSVGKIKNWQKIPEHIDAITYSAHKFGALKGVGFSFIKNNYPIRPLIFGGKQQETLRSGTLNTHGILSIKDALIDIESKDVEKVADFKLEIISLIKSYSNVHVIESECVNTICFYHDKIKADELLIHFDLNALCVSSGSACSSGSVLESPTLLEMGLGEKAKNSIRISIGYENLQHKNEIMNKIRLVLERLK